MRFARHSLLVLFFFAVSSSLAAQQTSTSSTQAQILLQGSLTALTGGQSITDITLSGTARRVAGSDDETGTATLKAIAGDAGRMELSLPSGSRSEILNGTTTPPTGSWSGPDGVSHPVAVHNLLTDSAWFFPAFTISRLLTSGNYVISYVGQETHNGLAVQHLTAYQSLTIPTPSGTPSFSHLTQMDLFLDSSTLLPAALDFNVHPDSDMGLDIPIEIRFSGYQAVSGAQIPFHVQKFINNSLLLDLLFQSAVLNSGLSTSLFNVQ